MKKNIVNCPIRNQEYDCTQCEFYTNEDRADGKYVCLHFATYGAMLDIAKLLKMVLDSNEQNRAVMEQSVLSQYHGKITPGLKTLLGIDGRNPIGINNEN